MFFTVAAWRRSAVLTDDGAQVVDEDDGIAGARGQQCAQLRGTVVVRVPA